MHAKLSGGPTACRPRRRWHRKRVGLKRPPACAEIPEVSAVVDQVRDQLVKQPEHSHAIVVEGIAVALPLPTAMGARSTEPLPALRELRIDSFSRRQYRQPFPIAETCHVREQTVKAST